MVERFFPTTNSERQSEVSSSSEGEYITLLSGPPSSGKTSLLFQYALNLVSHSQTEGFVVFICNRQRLESKPPFLSQSVLPSSPLFLRIHLKYVHDDQSLHQYFAAFHLLRPFPIAVIIDDFPHFFLHSKYQSNYTNTARARHFSMLHALALSRSAILHANQTAPCRLLISDTHHAHAPTPSLFFLYKPWISSLFTIHSQGQGSGCGSFLLNNTFSVKGSASRRTTTARYSIALHYLILEGITQDA